MSHKIEKPEGASEWFVPGIRCRVWEITDPHEIEIPIVWFDKEAGLFMDIDGSLWSHATPIEQWEPKEGEYCAFWDGGDSELFVIAEYRRPNCPTTPTNMRYMTEFGRWYDHVARIKGIDCACSLEELKKRTDWL